MEAECRQHPLAARMGEKMGATTKQPEVIALLPNRIFIRPGMIVVAKDGDAFVVGISGASFWGEHEVFIGDRKIVVTTRNILGVETGEYSKQAGCLVGNRYESVDGAAKEFKPFRIGA